ncbi:MAG: ABC transporter permease [Rhodobacteraceae bacterium]|nr:ABC transporter permease [Paracoccaceae bacterium]
MMAGSDDIRLRPRRGGALRPAAGSPQSRRRRRGAADLRARMQALAIRLALPLLLIALWAVAARSPGVAPVLPGPAAVLATLWQMTISGELFVHVAASLQRAFAGFVVAGIIGVAAGLAMSQSRLVNDILAGPVELLRPISSIAWIPLAILWFGIGFNSVVFVIVASCIFIILLNTLAAAQNVDRDLVNAALTLGATPRQIFTKVTVPSAMPGIMLGLRIAMTGAWGGVLIAEMIATREGLGYMIVRAQASYRPDIVIGGMIVIGFVGYALNWLFLALQRRITHV